ncbi:hypothetical protein HanRHA438_Chr14g0672471 [Helianthus annuus]|nr:hypothetical protein HanRHA438_Chr14g0672471 [Helianthus annuus]
MKNLQAIFTSCFTPNPLRYITPRLYGHHLRIVSCLLKVFSCLHSKRRQAKSDLAILTKITSILCRTKETRHKKSINTLHLVQCVGKHQHISHEDLTSEPTDQRIALLHKNNTKTRFCQRKID